MISVSTVTAITFLNTTKNIAGASVLGCACAVGDKVSESCDDSRECLVRRLRRVTDSISVHVTLGRQVTHQIAQRVLT